VFPPKPNSFAEEAALAVSQTSTEILDQLSDAGLLESSGAGRYTLHQTIADYAAAHLTETLASERLVAYVVAYLEKHATDYESLERENRNILAGLRYAYNAGQHVRFVQGVVAFAPFLLARGLYDQAKLHLQRAYHLTIWSGDTQTVMTTLLHLGYVAYKQEDHNQAEAHLREALALAREYADNQHIREALTYLSQVALARGDREQMEAYQQEAASLA
jgi:tetratricopeptide (TPR) repeat protein